MPALRVEVPSLQELRDKVKAAFGVTPCRFQEEDAIAQLQRKEDCITIAPTGAGKTLTFWIPLLFNDNRIKVIIMALNLLGDENVKELERLQITAVNLTAATTMNAYIACPLNTMR